MPSFMRPYATHTYAMLRIVTGFLFLWHGTQKLLSVPMPPPPQIPSFVIAIPDHRINRRYARDDRTLHRLGGVPL